MTGYRMMRTVTGRKVFVRMSREEVIDRRLYWLEVILAPIVMIVVFTAAAGMIF